MSAQFDLQTAVLKPGVTLLEASAGTGKTYTLAGIFFRLVTEHDLAPAQILVSTYTEAATAELRERIRSLLRKGWLAAESGESEDEFLREWFAAGHLSNELAKERLARALRNFDEAAIHTIHGFCRRMLQDRAFESGLVFNAELITDQTPLLRELADDFWRAHFHNGDPAATALALAEKIDPPGLAALLGQVVSHPLLRILPEAVSLEVTFAAIAEIFAELRAEWTGWRDEVKSLLCRESGWAKPKACSDWESCLELAEECIADPAARVASYDGLSEFCLENLQKGARVRQTPPEHPFFELCCRLQTARQALQAGINTNFLTWARAELPRRKTARNVITFDDLLTRLHAALHAPSGAGLAALIRGKFRAALIDEFQDTDAIQENIFRTLFRDGTSWLFLIGDPKQAIYGFRGADVFTYLNAAAGAPRFQLGTNYRSTTQLVEAVNTIFSQDSRAFVIDEISFTRVAASGRADQNALQHENGPRPPLHLWTWQTDKPITVKEAEDLLPRVVAAEAARMLSGKVLTDGKRLAPSDLAVLVVTNRQARLVQAAMNQMGIPSVLLTDETVFASNEAQELHTLLASIAEPSRETHLRAALATEAFGSTAGEIEALQLDEIEWERRLLKSQEYHEIWRDKGFITMFRRLLQEENIRVQTLRFQDGERRLTNLLHLGELLHHASIERRLGPGALLAWFATQRGCARPAGDNHELRLERDEAALQIATVHRSKGLEYSVVFCPFSWQKAELRKKDSVFFHEASGEHSLALDLGSDQLDEHKTTATRERLAEQTRLLYVALTRAKLQAHFVWGQFKGQAISAANWVLHPGRVADDFAAMTAKHEAFSPDEWRTEMKALAALAPDAISVVDLPSESAPRYQAPADKMETQAALDFRGRIIRDWRISSFSSLTIERDDEQPDRDPQIFDPAPIEDATNEKGIHAFPRGKKTGNCLHEIFEQLDFTNPESIEKTVAWKLAAFGFPKAEWSNPVIECVRNTLAAELAPGLALNRIDAASRLIELEFHLPVNHLSAEDLLRRLGPEAAGGLRFEPRRGMLKGYIDLVVMHEGRFFIIDWKSNHLGPGSVSYGKDALAAAMRQHHYGLQAHLYTLALHRYLALRQPDYDYDSHFGGVFYVFLRGVDPAHSERGIHGERPPRKRIEELSAYLAGKV